MSLQQAIEIEKRKVHLRLPLRQRIAKFAPYVFFAFYLIGSFALLFSSHPEKIIELLKFQVSVLAILSIFLFILHVRNKKRIEILELEVLKIKRETEEKIN